MLMPSAPSERAPTGLRDGDTARRDKRDLDLLCDTRGQDHIWDVALTRMPAHSKPSTVTALQPIRSRSANGEPTYIRQRTWSIHRE
jgi:hypothetical protein